jgi:TM2 domain-containing membrane protein YozV
MKKAISAPLCSAFVIPGLGQVLNQDIAKGLALLASVFILLVVGAVKLYLMINSAVTSFKGDALSIKGFAEHFLTSDFTTLWVLLGIFAILWAYSVVDALIRGVQVDAREKRETA